MPSRQFLAISFLFITTFCKAQTIPDRQPDGGGAYNFANSDEITPAQRNAIITMLQGNKLQLEKVGKWQAPVEQVTGFQWPIRQKNGINYNGFYGISNYVDENSAYPNQVLDYNCGTRSYDLSGGYNHQGTDIFTWPFPWRKMQYNEVEIIAAAPGTIIGKSDGLFDQNCAMCTSSCDWNAVYVRHADGSVAWYGHMKSGSLTSKVVGATVGVGEYLGVVGSSGSSTGPHLHFEVYESDTYAKLIDPWAGPCNAHNGNTSWWASQQPYRVSTLNALMIHSAAPVLPQCPAGEAANEKRSFTNGQVVYLGTYYRDQLNLQTVTHTVRRPDNSVYLTWNQNFTSDYSASYWYYYFTLPNPAPTGVWKYEVTYNSQTFSTNFAVNSMLQYTFNGNGNFTDAANWQSGNMPITPIPSGVEVIVNTPGANECIINQQIVFLPGSKLTIAPGSKLKMSQNLQMQ